MQKQASEAELEAWALEGVIPRRVGDVLDAAIDEAWAILNEPSFGPVIFEGVVWNQDQSYVVPYRIELVFDPHDDLRIERLEEEIQQLERRKQALEVLLNDARQGRSGDWTDGLEHEHDPLELRVMDDLMELLDLQPWEAEIVVEGLRNSDLPIPYLELEHSRTPTVNPPWTSESSCDDNPFRRVTG